MRSRTTRIVLGALLLLCAADAAWAQGFGRRRGPGPTPDTQPAPAPPAAPVPGEPSKALTPPREAPVTSEGGKKYGLGTDEAREALDRGDGRDALGFYERAAVAFEKEGDLANAARAYHDATFLAVRLAAFQRGIRAGQRALELFAQLPPAPEMARRRLFTASALAHCYRLVGDLASAKRVFLEALDRARAAPPQVAGNQVAIIGRGLATIAMREGDLEGAATRSRESAQHFEDLLGRMPRFGRGATATQREQAYRNLADALGLLGQIELARGELPAAEEAFKKVLALAKQTGNTEYEAEPMLGLGRVALERKEWKEAIDRLQRADTLAQKIGRTSALIGVAQNLARAHMGAGDVDRALASSRRAVDLVEQVRGELGEGETRSGFVEDKQQIYQFAVRLALQANRPDEAFAFAEGSRARAFLDLLGSQATLSKGRTRALAEEEIRLRNRARSAQESAEDGDDAAKGRLQEAQRAYQAFLERIRKENREQASLMTVEPVTVADVQKLLPEKTTLVEYLVTEAALVVWIVDRERIVVARANLGRAALVAAVREFRDAIAQQEPLEQLIPRAQRLYGPVFGVARPHIRHDRVLIVPHDVLHYLPFAALRSPQGRWLIEDYTLAALPSASVLRYLGDKAKGAGDRVLAVGNPALGAALNLRYAEREARLVGQRFPKADVLIREGATKARTKALGPAAGLIHFAVHGELNEADPMASALLLVPEGDDGGRLEVRELFGLDLHARLVVLSACETGLGKLSRGDELVGLQRAFLYAGTPAVITTLWKVDDRASYELVRAFYERLAAGDPARALRAAQTETTRPFPHPFSWAAFVLTGTPW